MTLAYPVPLLKAFYSSTVNFLYPPCCALFSKMIDSADHVLCDACVGRIQIRDDPCCGICGVSMPDGIHVCSGSETSVRHIKFSRTATAFDEPVQQLIHQLKYQRRRRVGIYFGNILGKMIENDDKNAHITLLAPVPLHRTRMRERGYNQSEYVTQGIAAITNIPVKTHLLERTRNTRSQTTLTSEERARNMRNVFRVTDTEAIKDRHIAIVDDVMTTGATLDSCAGALMDAGAAAVYALAIARA